jgi:ribosomal protein L37AE/L43A
MMNAALVPLIPAIPGQVLPFLLLAGVVGLFVGGVWRWLELSAPRAIHSRRTGRRRLGSNVAAINRSWESIPDCPMCNVPMVKRVARHGPAAGTQFWGCSNFPMCRCTKADRGRDPG